MNREYKIHLGEQLIGTTMLEKADAPMGVVFGDINCNTEEFNYEFWIRYCQRNSIELAMNEPEQKMLSTRSIAELKVTNSESGNILQPLSNQITVMDGDSYEITLEGINSAQMISEFSHHLDEYNKRF